MKKRLLFLSISLIFCLKIFAQTGTIKGKVLGTDSLPIPGASVRIKNTNIGTSTADDGSFSISAKGKVTLSVSAVGFPTKELIASDQLPVTIILQEDNKALGDVVVVGYGTQKKITVTGSIATIGTKELQQSPVANLSNALAGRLPGLITVQNSGEPGFDGSQLWIRGMATFSGSQAPLILVDGVERSFSSIDANEVESISILKDASSTAIYGVRGANGVVLVTTRRGVEGKPQITFTAQTGLQEPTRLPSYLDSYDALSLYRVGLQNDKQNFSQYTDEYLNKFRDRSHPAYEYLYPNVNWLKELLKPNSRMNQGNLNVSGGTKGVRYFTSISYLQQNGQYNFEDRIQDYNIQAVSNKYNFRSNIDLDVTKDLSMELNLGAIVFDNNYPPNSAATLFNALQSTPPWLYPMTNPNGTIAMLPAKPYNPYGLLTAGGYQRNFQNTLQATAGFNLNMPWITKGLSVKARLSFDSYNFRNILRRQAYFTYQYSLGNDQETDLNKGSYTKVGDGNNVLSYEVNANSNRRTNLEAYINYNRIFGQDHAVTGMFLYTQQSFFAAVGSGAAIEGLPFKYNGFVGRATYAYKNKYLGEVNFGYNGSENFPKGQRYDFFPSVSVGYVISNEDFFADNVQFINLLKLRASAGIVGNDKIGGRRFLYQSTWSLGGTGYQFGRNYDGNSFGGSIEDYTGNETVTWEQANKYNIGLDLGLWKDALTFTGDVFYERRNNILAQPGTLPSLLGITNLPLVNLGSVENKGFEVAVEYRKRSMKLGYFVKANFSFARNKILEMDEPTLAGRSYIQRTGRSINDQYSLIALGLFQSQAEINSSPDQSGYGVVQPGDIKYRDMNGDNKIDELDVAFLGKNSVPEKMAGFAFGFNALGFDLSVLFQGAFGGNVWLTGPAMWPFSGDSGILSDIKDNHWTPANPEAKYPRLSYASNSNNHRVSSFWLMSSDYLRLKNVELGYTIPTKLVNKIGLRTARIFMNGINLYTWDKMKIVDPETPNDSRNYPQQRVFNGGITFGL
ncbi:SusC/RagA family TonB-linked outer membrane protein [Pedobacter alluvionis]|uniref:TonB-dependent receptor n=1 Tax=Pedobacter alluvionis TaxID=475253 RepID=A0A497Y7L3_9SPHI|nr:TonB-dependent receptor [Pedobacter alluvionis]RLJ79544.1 TonB-linked SusC/RagA family outer membrane protein [Pedobacter alluvionis]TFB30887.1 TonB-dependent receptor [Pedobacter alluvionis]